VISFFGISGISGIKDITGITGITGIRHPKKYQKRYQTVSNGIKGITPGLAKKIFDETREENFDET